MVSKISKTKTTNRAVSGKILKTTRYACTITLNLQIVTWQAKVHFVERYLNAHPAT